MRKDLALTAILTIVLAAMSTWAQPAQKDAAHADGSAIALSPARFEAEMEPGSETTFVINLNYRSKDTTPTRVAVSLNDWTMTGEGQINYAKAGTNVNSASSWIVYSPSDAMVTPGKTNSIRVTISVPMNATPGDHVVAIIVEPRPDNPKLTHNEKVVAVRYRMASTIYVKVPGLVRLGSLEKLKTSSTPDGIAITPTLKNSGNSLIRPLQSAKLIDAAGVVVEETPELESLPVLAGSELTRTLLLEKKVAAGKYTVRYRVNFQDGGKVVEGVSSVVVP
jgi:methionine-rich copper-binding protein CopC